MRPIKQNKTITTQLTCSDSLYSFVSSNLAYMRRLGQNQNREVPPSTHFPNFAVGEVGDEEGVAQRDAPVIRKDGREETRRMFGIKRRQADREDQEVRRPPSTPGGSIPSTKTSRRPSNAFTRPSSKMERARHGLHR